MKQIYIFSAFLFSSFSILGQDQHFTQFFASPLTLNPALSGAFNGNYRVGLIYRDQGRNVLDDSYQTITAAVDLRFAPDQQGRLVKDAFGAGMLFYNDRVPSFDFSTNQMLISGAYHKSLGRGNEQFLSIGFQVGIAQRNINYENLTFEDQFDGSTGYTIDTDEALPENNFSYPDLAVGLNYAFIPQNQIAAWAGFSIHHFHNPQISFFYDRRADEQVGDNTLLTKIAAYVNLQVPLTQKVQLHPRALIYNQGPHLALNAGSNFRFLLSDVKGSALHVGGWMRPVRYEDESFNLDAAILMAGVEVNNFLLGVSYDVNISKATSFGQRPSAFEISIAYLGNYNNETILCPSF